MARKGRMKPFCFWYEKEWFLFFYQKTQCKNSTQAQPLWYHRKTDPIVEGVQHFDGYTLDGDRYWHSWIYWEPMDDQAQQK